MTDQNLTPDAYDGKFYVCGRTRSNEWVVVEYTNAGAGWRSKVVHGTAPELNNLYAPHDTRHDIESWWMCDFTSRTRTTTTLVGAMEHIDRLTNLRQR